MPQYDDIDYRAALLGIIASPAWNDIIAPAIERKRQEYNQILLDPRQKRRDNFNDDVTRGVIIGLTWVLKLPHSSLARIDSSLRAQQSDPYATQLDEPTSSEN